MSCVSSSKHRITKKNFNSNTKNPNPPAQSVDSQFNCQQDYQHKRKQPSRETTITYDAF